MTQRNPLVELGLPQSFTQSDLAGPPQRISSSHGLCFPTAPQESKVRFTRALPARHVPPSGFGYPLDGLLPSKPCRFCFAPAALLGFALRSLLLSKGIAVVSDRKNPHTVSPARIPLHRSAGAGLAGRASWALTLPRVPGDRNVFSTPTAGCSPGLSPSRATGRSLDQDFARSPLTRLLDGAFTSPPASQSLNRLPLFLIRPQPTNRTRVRVRHPHRIPAPS